MRKGTFSVKKAKSNSAAHNSRKYPPKYLIGLEPETENYYELIEKDEDFILAAQDIYQKKIGQKMQKKQIPNLILETVLTLKKEQDENTVKELFSKLNQKYGGHEMLEVSVHRDEGHFNFRGFALYPNKSIVKKPDGWYIQSDPTKPIFDYRVNSEELEPVYNYHAHVKFTMFNKETGRTARMNKGQMSSRIKFVSDELGLRYAPNEATRHASKPVGMVKDEHQVRYVEDRILHNKSTKIIKNYENKLSESREELLKRLEYIDSLKSDLSVLRASNDDLKATNEKLLKINQKLDEMLPRDEYGDIINVVHDGRGQMDARNRYEKLEDSYKELEAKYNALIEKFTQRAKNEELELNEKNSFSISQ